MYNFKKDICTNHKEPKKLKNYKSPMGTITKHCSECVNILDLGFIEFENT